MKTLLLMRHGKSDWNVPHGHDHDRPLAPRGERAARLMGQFLAAAGETPDSVVTSTAARAESTVRLAVEEGGWSCRIRVSERLYHPEVGRVLEEIRTEPDTTERLMVVGHEPAWSALLNALVGGGNHPFPTAAVARIDLPATTWAEVESGTGELRWLVTPRLLARVFDG